jgi:hypothetical protein
MDRVNVEACASFMDDGVLYKRGDVVALEAGNAADLRAAGFVRLTTRQPESPPTVAKGTYGRRDMKAKK